MGYHLVREVLDHFDHRAQTPKLSHAHKLWLVGLALLTDEADGNRAGFYPRGRAAEWCGVSPSRASHIAADMEIHGYVKRDGTHKRHPKYVLSPLPRPKAIEPPKPPPEPDEPPEEPDDWEPPF